MSSSPEDPLLQNAYGTFGLSFRQRQTKSANIVKRFVQGAVVLGMGLFLMGVFTSTRPEGTEQGSCPPENFHTKSPFDYQTFFNGKWYAIKQTEVKFQPKDSLFCVHARYQIELTKWCQLVGCSDQDVRVMNYGRKGVDGKRISAHLSAVIKDPINNPSKAMVGPWWLPSFLYGPYWVVDAGTYQQLLNDAPSEGNTYQWAIIAGGSPDVPSNDKCLPGVGSRNSKGLWLFSREPVPPKEVAEKLVALTAAKGLDTSTLLDVVQEGCDDSD